MGLTPSLPARLQGVPQVLINAIALPSGQMSLLFNHPSRLSWLGKKSLFLLLGQQIYSFIVTETGHRSGSSFCCLTCSHPLTWAAMAAADRCPLISSPPPFLSFQAEKQEMGLVQQEQQKRWGQGLEGQRHPSCPKGVALLWRRHSAAGEPWAPVSASLSPLDRLLRSLRTCF